MANPEVPPYLDTKLSPQKRAEDLVSRMTLEEKVGQMVNSSRSLERLGIPKYDWWNEALHGVARAGIATVFPQAIGRAAGFNVELEHEIAVAISDEGRGKYHEFIRKGKHGIYEGLTFWSPNINIFRDPRWGRGQETFGEDPYLTARFGVAFVKGMQGTDPKYLKTVATPKHYAVHSGPEPLRHVFDAKSNARDLWATYLPAFEACITEGGAWSIMSAYNRTNDEACSASPTLLQKILRDKWGFKGYVVSDCGAIDDIYMRHKVAATAEEAAAMSVKAGCDLECGGSYYALVKAVEGGFIDEPTIDKSLKRLMEARIRLGMFDPQDKVPYAQIPFSVVDCAKHRQLALKSAQESIVLLKNDGILPLKGAKTIAVIGPNADDPEVLLGNYNGTPSKSVTPLKGIEAVAPKGTTVLYAHGCDINRLAALKKDVPIEGIQAEYFDNMDLKGTPVVKRAEKAIDFNWGVGSPDSSVPGDGFSARWTGTFKPTVSGKFIFGAKADDGVRIYVDGKKVVDDWSSHAARVSQGEIELVEGKPVQVVVEYYEDSGEASCQLLWSFPGEHPFTDAIEAAKRADVVVACVGLNISIEEEEFDRKDIGIPKVQEDLLDALKATGKPVVVVFLNGGPVTSLWVEKNAHAIVEAWYPGEEGGTAIADVLFGRYNPAGRMPVTIYRSLDQVPPIEDYDMSHGRTYRYFTGSPLYEFGYGLSYTTFGYRGLKVPSVVDPSKGATVEVEVTNTGKMAGDEVVQLYLSHGVAGAPIRELKGFKRVHLGVGETKKVAFALKAADLAVIDENGEKTWPAGVVRVSVGGGQPDGSGGSFAKVAGVTGEFKLSSK